MIRALVILLASVLSCLAQLTPPSSGPRSVTLAWDVSPSPNIATYFLYIGYNSGQYVDKLNTGNTNQFTVSDLISGKTYYFVATASDGEQESVFSNEVSYTVASRPLPPTLHPIVSLTVQSKALGVVQWTDRTTVMACAQQTNQAYRLKIGPAPPPIPDVKATKLASPKHTN